MKSFALEFILIVALLVIGGMFIMRQLQNNSGKAMSFGKSRAKLLNETRTRSRLATSPASMRPKKSSRKSWSS